MNSPARRLAGRLHNDQIKQVSEDEVPNRETAEREHEHMFLELSLLAGRLYSENNTDTTTIQFRKKGCPGRETTQRTHTLERTNN